MFKTSITFALKDSKTATQEETKIYIKLAMASLDAGGATWTEHIGGYLMADGTAVFEPSYTVDVLTSEPIESDKVHRFAEFIKHAEQQESVLVEKTILDAEFI